MPSTQTELFSQARLFFRNAIPRPGEPSVPVLKARVRLARSISDLPTPKSGLDESDPRADTSATLSLLLLAILGY